MRPKAPKAIDSYAPGSITIGGKTYTADLILLPDRIFPNWWRSKSHEVAPGDLELVFHTEPEILIVGTGDSGLMDVPTTTRTACAKAGIRLIVQPTAQAVETYNRLLPEKRLAAALHLTC
jgi:hypothetical protein